MQFPEAAAGAGLELGDLAKLNRFRGAGFGAGRLQAVFQAIIAKRAFVGPAISQFQVVARDDAKGAGDDAISAAVADILLDVDRIKLGADDRASRACLQTSLLISQRSLLKNGREAPGAFCGMSPLFFASVICSSTVTPGRRRPTCSINCTCRQVWALSCPVLS